ncbi:uncharacterized protein LOC124499733 [Dermatophagoides farinae]|nr:hypothetical protein HUG17_0934 [Dermatophagoides farinae]
MAHSNSMIIFASILFILLSGDGLLRPLDNTIFVHAYYCDNDYCNSEQFCCGENICCDYVNNTIWHFICYLISFIVFAFILWGIFQLIMGIISNMKYPKERTKTNNNNNNDNNNKDDDDDENRKFTLI